jgi:hypothetical protein
MGRKEIFYKMMVLSTLWGVLNESLGVLPASRQILPRVIQETIRLNWAQAFKKEALQQAQAAWRPLTIEEQQGIDPLLTLDFSSLLQELKKRGLAMVAMGTALSPLPGGESIAPKLFKEIKATTHRQRLLSPKMKSGEAMGKFICRENLLLINARTTRGTLIHEWLHSRQNKNNGDYCPAISDQEKIERQFKKKTISRQQYEEIILRYQAINAVAEEEVYRIMAGKHFSAWEDKNNLLLLQKYSRWAE